MFFYGEQMACQLRDIYLADESQSVLLEDLPQRQNPPFLKRFWESLVRLISPLM